MRFTYDLNTNGCLILYADNQDRHNIAELIRDKGTTYAAEWDALESLICNSELEWIRPEEIGALTDAPILGFRGKDKRVPKRCKYPEHLHIVYNGPDGAFYAPVTAAWGFMDYQVRSFLEDLRDKGKAVFVS